jgi:septin family protein
MNDDISIIPVIMRRDQLTLEEATEQLNEAREAVAQGYDPEQACYDFFGLEPDYCFDLM